MTNMRKMKKYVVMLCAMLAMGAFTASCSSDEEAVQGVAGEGLIAFDVKAETGFQSRAALSEADYKDLDNYTVQLLDGEGATVEEWNYAELPESYTVLAGTYQVKAFYGDATVVASTEKMYVEGISDKKVITGKEQAPTTFSVACKPTCAKVIVKFDETMADYFTSYQAEFETAAMGETTFTWKMDDTAPVYLKVNENEQVPVNFHCIRKSDGTSVDLLKTYTLSPNKGLTITVKPQLSGEGGINISITVDETTNDIEQDIDVPGDWVTDKEEDSNN